MKTIEVNMPLLSFIGWGGTVFFLFGFVMIATQQSATLACIFLPFVALALFLLLFSGLVSIDHFGIWYKNKFSRYFISWDEIETIETGKGNLVIGNEQKWIAMPDPEYWNARKRDEAWRWITAFADAKDIRIHETRRAIFRFPKNTKMSSN